MNSEDSQIPEANKSSSEVQNSQGKIFDSTDNLENLTESKDELALNSEDSKSSVTTDSSADSWFDTVDINQVDRSNLETDLVDRPENDNLPTTTEVDNLKAEIQTLQQQKETLTQEISTLEAQKQQFFEQQFPEIQVKLVNMVEKGTEQLEERKNTLQREIDKLERRQERIRQEMRTNFAGASQELAIRVQGFKDYLVGSLQDLAAAAEQLQLPNLEAKTPSPARQRPQESTKPISSELPQFTEQGFVSQEKKVRQLIDKYRSRPDYYGPPWQLRRTFEPIHAERVQDWFFTQGGRGTVKSMGSRLQNILVASAIISVIYRLYGESSRILILVDTPERLGEWRRGLQDCLGISRADFGANRGVVLFESPEILIQRAERLKQDKLIPLVIIDETEESINLALLRFPLWLAFAGELQPTNSGYLY